MRQLVIVCGVLAGIAVIIVACAKVSPRLPPPGIDPNDPDGSVLIINDPWPQHGPFRCHVARAPDGDIAMMCARTEESCGRWRERNELRGFTVSACRDELSAHCFTDAQSHEVCMGTEPDCERFRLSVPTASECRLVQAIVEIE